MKIYFAHIGLEVRTLIIQHWNKMRIYLFLVILLIPILLDGQNVKVKEKRNQYYFYVNGKKALKPYQKVIDVYYNENYVVKSNKWGVVDKYGKEVVSCKYDTVVHQLNNYFIVRSNDKYGVINKDEKIMVDIIYQDIDHFTKELSSLVKLNDVWGVLKDGRIEYNKDSVIFISPDELPKFKDCKDEGRSHSYSSLPCQNFIVDYIYNKLEYPAQALSDRISGIVVIRFVVSETGSILNPTIVRDIGGGCGEEAKSVIQTMDKWIPGKQDGKNVKTQITLPVRFELKL